MGIAAAPQKLKTVGPTTLPLLVAYELQHPQSYKWLNTFCASPLLRLRCCMRAAMPIKIKTLVFCIPGPFQLNDNNNTIIIIFYFLFIYLSQFCEVGRLAIIHKRI
jgi:hypothetical protein